MSDENELEESGEEDILEYGIMRYFNIDSLVRDITNYRSLQKAYIDPIIQDRVLMRGGSINLLTDNFAYSITEWNQAECGDCWVWVGTAMIAIDLSVSQGIKDKISIQFLNSCHKISFACCGGDITLFTDFYNLKKMCIPWSNTNASFKDQSAPCTQETAINTKVSCSSIKTTPNYPLVGMEAVIIDTVGVTQAVAIANIKNVLEQKKAILFSLYMTKQSDWNSFQSFFTNQPETFVWNPDTACNNPWVHGESGGHALTIVGYNDTSSIPYWIVLNSWGTGNGNRPSGCFRMKMNMNYDCTMTIPGEKYPYASRIFSTLNIQWPTVAPQPTSDFVIISPSPGSSITTSSVKINWTPNGYVYGIDIGFRGPLNGIGSYDFFSKRYEGSTSSINLSNIPTDRRKIYVRYWYKAKSTSDWEYKDYTYN